MSDVWIHTDKERVKAMNRALKMAVLFQTKHFDKVMDPVYKIDTGEMTEEKAFAAFKAACGKATIDAAQLEDAEIDWLWNYLKNYKEMTYATPRNKYSAGIGW